MAKIEMSKADLVDLVNSLTAPDGAELLPLPRWDPILQRWVLVFPFPPPQPDPRPDWVGRLTRTVTDRAQAQARLAQALGDGVVTEAALVPIRAEISQFTEELTGNNVSITAGLPPADVAASYLLLAGAQFQAAADLLENEPLRAEFTAAADRLIGTGLERLTA
jgi:hypothetical protein